MIRQRLGQIEMDSALAVALERLEVNDGLDFTLSRHDWSTRFYVTRLADGYYVFSTLYAPHLIGLDESHPGERFDDIEGVWTEIDSQLDK